MKPLIFSIFLLFFGHCVKSQSFQSTYSLEENPSDLLNFSMEPRLESGEFAGFLVISTEVSSNGLKNILITDISDLGEVNTTSLIKNKDYNLFAYGSCLKTDGNLIVVGNANSKRDTTVWCAFIIEIDKNLKVVNSNFHCDYSGNTNLIYLDVTQGIDDQIIAVGAWSTLMFHPIWIPNSFGVVTKFDFGLNVIESKLYYDGPPSTYFFENISLSPYDADGNPDETGLGFIISGIVEDNVAGNVERPLFLMIDEQTLNPVWSVSLAGSNQSSSIDNGLGVKATYDASRDRIVAMSYISSVEGMVMSALDLSGNFTLHSVIKSYKNGPLHFSTLDYLCPHSMEIDYYGNIYVNGYYANNFLGADPNNVQGAPFFVKLDTDFYPQYDFLFKVEENYFTKNGTHFNQILPGGGRPRIWTPNHSYWNPLGYFFPFGEEYGPSSSPKFFHFMRIANNDSTPYCNSTSLDFRRIYDFFYEYSHNTSINGFFPSEVSSTNFYYGDFNMEKTDCSESLRIGKPKNSIFKNDERKLIKVVIFDFQGRVIDEVYSPSSFKEVTRKGCYVYKIVYAGWDEFEILKKCSQN